LCLTTTARPSTHKLELDDGLQARTLFEKPKREDPGDGDPADGAPEGQENRHLSGETGNTGA
jgi:hypothetical protein